MSLALTTWEDLQNLGWSKQRIHNTLNEQRDRTISTLDDVALNEGFAKSSGWYCYNAFKDQALKYVDYKDPKVEKGNPIWAHTTSGELKFDFEDTVKKRFGTIVSVEGRVIEKPTIGISSGIEVSLSGLGKALSLNFRGSDFSAQPQTVDNTTQQAFPMRVPPGETWRLYAEKTTVISEQEVHVTYGLTDESEIGTRGEPFKGESYWSYKVNEYLKTPEGTMKIIATHTTTIITPILVSVGPDGEETPIEFPKAGAHDTRPNPKESEENDPEAAGDTPSA